MWIGTLERFPPSDRSAFASIALRSPTSSARLISSKDWYPLSVLGDNLDLIGLLGFGSGSIGTLLAAAVRGFFVGAGGFLVVIMRTRRPLMNTYPCASADAALAASATELDPSRAFPPRAERRLGEDEAFDENDFLDRADGDGLLGALAAALLVERAVDSFVAGFFLGVVSAAAVFLGDWATDARGVGRFLAVFFVVVRFLAAR